MRIEDIRPKIEMASARNAYDLDAQFYESAYTQFKPRVCPGCESSNFNFFTKQGKFEFSKCMSCWCVFMNPGPSPELIFSFYQNSNIYKYWGEHVYPASAENRHSKLTVPRAEYVLASTKSNSESTKKFLEIGSGTGDVIKHIIEIDPNIEGFALEPNPAMWSNYDNSSVNLLKNQIEDDLDEKNKFNVIFAFEVLEHLLEPKLLLSKVRDLLLPKGRFVASTPNAASLEVNIMKNHSNTLDIEHISILTPSSIHSLASQNNFKVIKIETPGKFDLQLMSEKYRGLILPLLSRSFTSKSQIQENISEFGFSSHMKFVLEKIK
jgi:2-polyprenyl-3-methyl-5-hydroxy-6-metoxy-1,4-benzoquinol methylase